jgi:uncharacterized phiE125 gp8 family phage protein
MIYQVTTTTPSGTVVSLDDLKSHVAIDQSETYYNSMITSMEAAAVAWIESRSRVLLRPVTATIYVDEFPKSRDALYIPLWPVRSLTTLKYRNKDGTLVTLTPQQSLSTPPSSLYPAINEVWPETRQEDKQAVEIICSVGYTTPPAMAVHAIKMLVAHWFRNRETVLVGTISKELEKSVDALLVQFRQNYWTPFGVYQ